MKQEFIKDMKLSKTLLHKKCPYSELFWSVFSCIRENTDQNNSEYGHFLRSALPVVHLK